MLKREIKRQLERYGKFLDIFLAFVFVSLIVIPVLTVINLSPKRSTAISSNTNKNDNVLGVETYTGDEIQLKQISGEHNYIQNEELYRNNDTSFLYSTRLVARDAGIYGKPILQLDVPEGETVEITFSIASVENTTTQIGISYDKVNYILRASDGEQFIRSLKFDQSGSYKLNLDIRNNNKINFPEVIDIRVNFKTY